MKMHFFLTLVLAFLYAPFLVGQDTGNGKTKNTTYKKRVLESTEVDILSSFYWQDGNNASVTGGIGTEELTDATSNIVVSIPLNDNDVLTVDVGISAYTSASSGNIDPFDGSGASQGYDDDDDPVTGASANMPRTSGSPWVASSGASSKDLWWGATASYAHSSDDRNRIWSVHGSFAKEYDYYSIGFGGGYVMLFNEKNTELGISANLFFDNWNPKYPTELDTYLEVNKDLTTGFFNSVDIWDKEGNLTDKTTSSTWKPIGGDAYKLIEDTRRNTYAASFSFSQILSKNLHFSLFLDIVNQQGWLANPSQRVYFANRPNYYIGNPASINNYESPTNNKDVFALADDIERLPSSRLKVPIGARFNYYLNESFTLRTYYRYYADDWSLFAHTVNIELPIKLGLGKFTLYPSYRYYTQTSAAYFASFDNHLSTSDYYTSDFDLSAYSASQFGLGVSYTDIFSSLKILGFGLKNIDLKYNYYQRSSGLIAHYIGIGFKFVM